MKANELIERLSHHSDSDRAAAMQQYMRDKFQFYGIGSPRRKELAKDFIRQSTSFSVQELFDVAEQLWEDPYRESQYIATDMLVRNKKRLSADHMERVIHLIITKSWWDTVDALASHVVGRIFERDKECRDHYLDAWIPHENIWLNRTGLIFQLKYGIRTDVQLLNSIILKLKHKDEFFIQKAIGWSLRQASKFYPEDVRAFLECTELSNLARKEASKYL